MCIRDSIKPDTHDVRSGMTPKEQLEAIYKAVRPLYRKREHICSLLSQRLRAEGVRRMDPSKLSGEERDYCARYFDTCMEPVISPQIVDNLHPFPHLKNNILQMCIRDSLIIGTVAAGRILAEVEAVGCLLYTSRCV